MIFMSQKLLFLRISIKLKVLFLYQIIIILLLWLLILFIKTKRLPLNYYAIFDATNLLYSYAFFIRTENLLDFIKNTDLKWFLKTLMKLLIKAFYFWLGRKDVLQSMLSFVKENHKSLV